METAEKFFYECENGAGWKGCQQYCHQEATFSSEAKTLTDVDTLDTIPTGWCKFTSVYPTFRIA